MGNKRNNLSKFDLHSYQPIRQSRKYDLSVNTGPCELYDKLIGRVIIHTFGHQHHAFIGEYTIEHIFVSTVQKVLFDGFLELAVSYQLW